MENLIELTSLIKKFRDKFFHGPVKGWSYQYKFDYMSDVVYYPPPCSICELKFKYTCRQHEREELSDKALLNNFDGKPVKINGGHIGTIAVRPVFTGKIVKWFVIDADNDEATKAVIYKIIPVFKSYNIDFIFERGSKDTKCHIWFMVNCSLTTLNDFTEQLLQEADIDVDGKDKDLELEVYPYKKPNALIRIPGGIHLRNNLVNPIIWRNKEYSNPIDIVKVFVAANQLQEDEIKSVLKAVPRLTKTYNTTSYLKNYLSLELESPDVSIPENLKTITSNCQAINKIIKDSLSEDLLEKKGWKHHTAGLYLSGICTSLDQRFHTKENSKWFLDFVQRVRHRDFKDHNWEKELNTNQKLFPRCQTFDRDFGLCEGCPFKNKIDSAKEFSLDKEIVKTKVREVKLVSLDEVRGGTFETVKTRVIQCVDSGVRTDILLASPMGAGKSYLVDEIATILAKKGKTCLFAVPTAKLALEHRDRIRAFGSDAYLLMSHQNIFKQDEGRKRFNIDFDCPEKEEITRLSELGVSGNLLKKQFCGRCPFKEVCPYPGQYARATEDEHRIVIIQHAHFSCKETLYSLLSKKTFDVMFVDEEFIDSLIKDFKVTPEELAVFESLSGEIVWLEDIVKWLKQEVTEPGKAITPKTTELELIRDTLLSKLLPWNLSEYLSQYNYKHKYDKNTGLIAFFSLPNIPVRVFTDATPPLEMLKIVLNNKFIETYGKDEILDYRLVNPANKIIQVLDNKTSKTNLSNKNFEKFYLLLEWIGDLCHSEHRNKKILITTYAGEFTELAAKFFRLNYPAEFDNMIITHMAIGTNQFEDCDVQFQLAGVHLNALQLAMPVYELKSVVNYWNRLAGREEVANSYPYFISPTSGIDYVSKPAYRIEEDGINGALFKYEDEGIRNSHPEDFYYNLIFKLSLAKRQQAVRLRFNNKEKSRIVYILDNEIRNSLLISRSMLFNDLIFLE